MRWGLTRFRGLESFTLKTSEPSFTRKVVAHGTGFALPACVALGCAARPKQRTKVFHAPLREAVFIDIKTMHHQRLAVDRHLGFGRRQDAAGCLHAEVFVQTDEGQIDSTRRPGAHP